MKYKTVIAGFGILAIGLTVGVGAPTPASADMAATVDKRIKLMKNMRNAASQLKRMIKKKTYDAGKADSSAKSIKADVRLILASFPKGSAVAPSEAKEEIWTQWADFEKLTQATIAAADKLAEVATDEGAMTGAYKALQDTCDTCHDKYIKE